MGLCWDRDAPDPGMPRHRERGMMRGKKGGVGLENRQKGESRGERSKGALHPDRLAEPGGCSLAKGTWLGEGLPQESS